GADAERHIIAWAGVWCPWMCDEEVISRAAGIIARPLKWKADTLGWRLRLSYAEREELGITTIGSFDADKTARERRRKLKRAARDREQRRKKGARPREEYLATSLARTRPWERLGISRATWYRRRVAFGRVEPSHGRLSSANSTAETSCQPAEKLEITGEASVSTARRPAGELQALGSSLAPSPSAAGAADGTSGNEHPTPVHDENERTAAKPP